MSTIVDLAAKQLIVLDDEQKTATVTSTAPAAAAAAAPATAATGPTRGRAREADRQVADIDGVKCDEYTFTTTMDMARWAAAQMPPEAAAMMKGMKMIMTGSMWVAKDAPGAAGVPGVPEGARGERHGRPRRWAPAASSIPGMDKLMKAMGSRRRAWPT